MRRHILVFVLFVTVSLFGACVQGAEDPSGAATAPEIFYGEWRVSGVVFYGSANAGETIARKSLGDKVVLDADHAYRFNRTIRPVYYPKEYLSENQVFRRWGVRFDELGIEGDSVLAVWISNEPELPNGEYTLLVRDQNSLLTISEGICFELVRVK